VVVGDEPIAFDLAKAGCEPNPGTNWSIRCRMSASSTVCCVVMTGDSGLMISVVAFEAGHVRNGAEVLELVGVDDATYPSGLCRPGLRRKER
jgi:hypothetical protein